MVGFWAVGAVVALISTGTRAGPIKIVEGGGVCLDIACPNSTVCRESNPECVVCGLEKHCYDSRCSICGQPCADDRHCGGECPECSDSKCGPASKCSDIICKTNADCKRGGSGWGCTSCGPGGHCYTQNGICGAPCNDISDCGFGACPACISAGFGKRSKCSVGNYPYFGPRTRPSSPRFIPQGPALVPINIPVTNAPGYRPGTPGYKPGIIPYGTPPAHIPNFQPVPQIVPANLPASAPSGRPTALPFAVPIWYVPNNKWKPVTPSGLPAAIPAALPNFPQYAPVRDSAAGARGDTPLTRSAGAPSALPVRPSIKEEQEEEGTEGNRA